MTFQEDIGANTNKSPSHRHSTSRQSPEQDESGKSPPEKHIREQNEQGKSPPEKHIREQNEQGRSLPVPPQHVLEGLQPFAGTLAVGPSFLSVKELGTLKKKGWTWVYLLQYCMDLGDLIGKIYLFHQGFPSVLTVLGNI
jgi:hypothetical protein